MKHWHNLQLKATLIQRRLLLEALGIFIFFVGLAVALSMVIGVLVSAILSKEYTVFFFVMSAICVIGIGVFLWIAKGLYAAVTRLRQSFLEK